MRRTQDASQAPVLCLTGPTACGKSAAAMALAERMPIEIVSVDSAQVYRGMDVGTAKPDRDDRARVPHHLIDLIDPSESYSVARFVDDAGAAIRSIRARGRVPLLVGGTMLYVKAFRDGLDELPATDPAIRGAVALEASRRGWAAMHGELARVDPATAMRLAPLDAQRISRALEVYRSTGVPLSKLQGGHEPRQRRELIIVSLEPSDRSALHRRIAERFDAMLARGFVDEVGRLHARGDLDASLPSIRCVGYRQAWDFVEGRIDAATMRERAIAATRRLAKRQVTWLRSMPDRVVIDGLDAHASLLAADALLAASSARVNEARASLA